MFLWYQIPCWTYRSVAIIVFTAYLSGPWLHWSALTSPDLPHLRPEATAFACGPRNPFQLCPASSVPCWAESQGSVKTSCFPRDGYNDWLGEQGGNGGPEIVASGVSQFYPERNDETLNLWWPSRLWRAMRSINSSFFSLSFEVVTLSAMIYFWLTVLDPFSFLCQSRYVSKYTATG